MKKFQITFKGQVYELDVEEIGSATPAPAATKTVAASTPAPTPVKSAAPKAAAPKAAPTPAGAQTVLAPMPGKIFKVNVQTGDSIKRGDVICVLEAMKMENEIMATQDGKVSEVRVKVGQLVSTGDVLVVTA
ncbi:biotin/lipoyl-containing protein [Pelosinus sp. sgz500959]|uniref:biotin/lipoyl-containing protein n=1 Tax=Pelosinus sp. sgz500959 TaxID=3242472 RepID=UPI003672022A